MKKGRRSALLLISVVELIAVEHVCATIFVRMDIPDGAVRVFIPGQVPVHLLGVCGMMGVIALPLGGYAAARLDDGFRCAFNVDFSRIAVAHFSTPFKMVLC